MKTAEIKHGPIVGKTKKTKRLTVKTSLRPQKSILNVKSLKRSNIITAIRQLDNIPK